MTEPIRVVVVDDPALLRTGFRMILESAGHDVVAEAEIGLQQRRIVEIEIFQILAA